MVTQKWLMLGGLLPAAPIATNCGPDPIRSTWSALTGLNRHAEETLVEVERALRIRHAERHVIERAHLQRGTGPCAMSLGAAISVGPPSAAIGG